MNSKIYAFITTLFFSSGLIAEEKVLVTKENTSYEQFTECTATTAWLIQGNSLNNIDDSKIIKIPAGWKVVGTNMSRSQPIFFICR